MQLLTKALVGCCLLLPTACDSQASERTDTRAPSGTAQPLGDQTRVVGRTVADWNKLQKDDFVREMDAQLAGFDSRIDAANESLRAELKEKRQQAQALLNDVRARVQGASETIRQDLLTSVRWLEQRLEKQ